MHRVMWTGSIVVGAAGVALFAYHFDEFGSPWRFVALGMVLVSCIVANTAVVVSRQRTLDEEFNAGYKAGHRAGRRMSHPSGVVSIEGRTRSGRISTPPLGPMASHRATAGRAQAHQD